MKKVILGCLKMNLCIVRKVDLLDQGRRVVFCIRVGGGGGGVV